jgi:pimeloyl-ACP methyl ester carboxylesterase
MMGHGFAGSGAIMRGFAYTLAHAGFVVGVWDFDGHGANPNAFQDRPLLENADQALREILSLGLGDPNRVAILGHSMGSGVALDFGLRDPDVDATIAVSPVPRPVTPGLPRNLLLMAGELEPPFLQRARTLLEEAGGSAGDPEDGSARALRVIPGVEHISILFSPNAHQVAREWLEATFGAQPGARDYVDRRVGWYGLGVVGALTINGALAMLFGKPQGKRPRDPSRRRRFGALLVGSLGATFTLAFAGWVGFDLRSLGGMQVGGYLLLWFGLAGVFNLALARVKPPRPGPRDFVISLVVFAALWLGVGLLGQTVWLPWILIPRRLILWPVATALLLPWFFALGDAMVSSSRAGSLGWWFAHATALTLSLLLGTWLDPEMGFMILILPVMPIILALTALGASPYSRTWPYALGGSMFTGWLLLAVFPLS